MRNIQKQMFDLGKPNTPVKAGLLGGHLIAGSVVSSLMYEEPFKFVSQLFASGLEPSVIIAIVTACGFSAGFTVTAFGMSMLQTLGPRAFRTRNDLESGLEIYRSRPEDENLERSPSCSEILFSGFNMLWSRLPNILPKSGSEQAAIAEQNENKAEYLERAAIEKKLN